jgi:hypothetical protein
MANSPNSPTDGITVVNLADNPDQPKLNRPIGIFDELLTEVEMLPQEVTLYVGPEHHLEQPGTVARALSAAKSRHPVRMGRS